ncbi:hypothetical protein SSP35_04_05000 [Streptomyces sp. NBRC 110611]|nr:hypothetical protein SSP35_04_05000 [Streptomyces sp. NBRC 110611]
MRAVNTVVHALSARHGGVHLHLAEEPWVAERGHRLPARGFPTALAGAGLSVGPSPGLALGGRPPSRTGSMLPKDAAGTEGAATMAG